MRKINIPIFVPHAGCTHACVFCNQRRITGQHRSMDAAAAQDIIDTALSTVQQGAYIEIAFFGGSFTAIDAALQIELLETAHVYIQDGRVQGIRISTRPDCIDEEILHRLKTYGVTAVELGVQSTNDDVLRRCKRGHTRADVFAGAEMVRAAGFDLGLQMMPGLPGDSAERTMQTVTDIVSLKPVCVRIYPTLVIADSPLYDMYNCGEYVPLPLEQAVELCAAAYAVFSQNGIEVLRMGLMASESLESGIAAGPYHPAFGELVESRLYIGKILRALDGYSGGAVLRVHPRELSKAIGNRRCNIEYVKDKLNINLTIKGDETVEVGAVMW